MAEESHAPEPFRLTYSTMFDPPVELHQRFDAALARVRTQVARKRLAAVPERRSGTKRLGFAALGASPAAEPAPGPSDDGG